MKKLIFVLCWCGLLGLLGSGERLTAQESAEPLVQLAWLAGGFAQPLGLVSTGVAGDGRLFVVEKGGRVRILYPTGGVEPRPFFNISNFVALESERGLLGLAFDPDYANNGYFYVNYSRYDDDFNKHGDTVIARYRVQPDDPNLVQPNSGEVLLVVAQDFANHNGGDLHFGPDGYLYIALGDGGSGGDPNNRGQTRDNLLGAVLRIDVHGTGGDGACGAAEKYGIPADNPFVGQVGACSEIWAYGLRNPWRMSFDRLTHDLFIADVGQNAWEEVNFQPAESGGGENYGWRCYEGTHEFGTANTAVCPPPETTTMPFFEYDHTIGASVTGGYVYRGGRFPSFYGTYFFGDFVTGAMWAARPGTDAGGWQISRVTNIPTLSISAFGQDNAGELYVVDFGGAVYRLVGQDEHVFFPLVFTRP